MIGLLTNMIKEQDRVVLKEGIPDQGLKTGDVGTVIHVYKKGEAFRVCDVGGYRRCAYRQVSY